MTKNINKYTPQNKKTLFFIIQYDIYIYKICRVFVNGDQGSNPSRVIPKVKNFTWWSLLNTQYYKLRIKSKEEKSREKSSALLNTLV